MHSRTWEQPAERVDCTPGRGVVVEVVGIAAEEFDVLVTQTVTYGTVHNPKKLHWCLTVSLSGSMDSELDRCRRLQHIAVQEESQLEMRMPRSGTE